MVCSRSVKICYSCLPALPGPTRVLVNYVLHTFLCTSIACTSMRRKKFYLPISGWLKRTGNIAHFLGLAKSLRLGFVNAVELRQKWYADKFTKPDKSLLAEPCICFFNHHLPHHMSIKIWITWFPELSSNCNQMACSTVLLGGGDWFYQQSP